MSNLGLPPLVSEVVLVELDKWPVGVGKRTTVNYHERDGQLWCIYPCYMLALYIYIIISDKEPQGS